MSPSCQSEAGVLKRVVLKHVRDAFVDESVIDAEWEALGYLHRPDFALALKEYDAFVDLLQDFGIEPLFLPRSDGVGLDSIYARDAAVVTDGGAILCNMGKDARRGEPAAQRSAYEAWGVSVRGEISGDGRLEGGDVVWLDERTLAVARGYRSNAEGIRQLAQLLGPEVEVVTVPLPHFRGPSDVFHLMSIVSPVDHDLAVVYSPLMSVPFRELLLERRITLVEVPEAEYDALGCNVLTVSPRVCVVAEGAPETRRRMEAQGIEVHTFQASEICVAGSGGPTCLTRTLERDV
jgi:N-dimethylarginine dimethylaminohydrolase